MSESEERPQDNFDLLRELIAAEYPDRLSLFDQCTHRFRRTAPDDDIYSFIIATGFVALLFRSVPERIAAVLTRFEAGLNRLPAEKADSESLRLAGAEAIGPQANRFAGLVQRLEAAGAESLTRLDKATTAHAQAAEAHRKASRTSDLLFYAVTLLAVAFLGGVIGFLLARVLR